MSAPIPVAVSAPARPGPPRWLPILLVVAAVLAPLAWVPIARMTAVGDGTATNPTAPPWTADGVVLARVTGQPGDLRPQDRIVAVDGVPLETWVSDRPDRTYSTGQRVTYQVIRPGSTVPVDVPVTLIPYPFAEIAAERALSIPLLVLMLAVASFVFLNRPRDRAARALFGVAALLPLGITEFPLATQVIDLVNGPRVWPTVVGNVANALVWGALLHFFLVFPEARGILARRPRAILVVYAMPFVLHAAFIAVVLPSADGDLGRLGRLVPVSVVAGHVFPFLVAAAAVVQYRAARDQASRQRLRWILAVVVVTAALYIGLGQLPDKVIGHPIIPWEWVPLCFAPFPLVLGASVLRYQLFDIQIIVRRSLVYGALTTLLVALYIAVITLFDAVFPETTRVAPLIATALVAVLFQPLRLSLRRVISQLVFGARDDPYEVLARLGQQLEATVSADAVLDGAVTTLARTLRLPYAAIELYAVDGARVPASTFGSSTGEPVEVALVHQGTELGRLILDTGPAREQFGPADQRLLDALARQIAVVAHNVQLTLRLRRSLEQTVTAREEERRRLRRDIHDGLGPALAAGTMQLEVARRLVHSNPTKAEDLLTKLADSQQSLIADLRRLVEGLRPPVLDQLGLVPALRQRATGFATGTSPLVVHIDADGDIEPLPAAVEVAAYHIVLESLTNTARHARATEATVQLRRSDGLLVEVRDNGYGLPDSYRAGVGLTSIRERATELGGSASITSAPGGGTLVRARLPLPG